MHGADVWMVERGYSSRLLFEAVAESFMRDLDRNHPAQARIHGTEYLSHTTLAQQRFNDVRAQPGPGRNWRWIRIRDKVCGSLVEKLAAALRILRQ